MTPPPALPPAAAAWLGFLAGFLLVDYGCYAGWLPGGSFSAYVRENESWTLPVFVAVVVLLFWHFFVQYRPGGERP